MTQAGLLGLLLIILCGALLSYRLSLFLQSKIFFLWLGFFALWLSLGLVFSLWPALIDPLPVAP